MCKHRIAARASAMIVSLALAACTSAPWNEPIKGGPVDTGAGSLTAARKYLEGRWTLLSYEVFLPGEAPIALGGSGMLTYDAYGNLTTKIRVDDATALILEKAGIRTSNGAFLTSGRTAVDMNARTLTYLLDGQPPLGAASGPLALNKPRFWQVEGTLLTLTTKGEDGATVSVGRWQKAE
jgi:hypothetical protein